MNKKQFKKGDVIFREGDRGDTLYQINDGKVGIYLCYGEGDEKLLTELSKDKFFGEMAVIEAYPRSATAVALTDSDVDEIASGEVNDYFKGQPDKIIELMKSLGGRLRELTKDYDEVSDTLKAVVADGDTPKDQGILDSIKKFADVFRRTKAADKLSAETLRKLSQSGHSEGFAAKVDTYSKGTVIFKEGETGDCMYDVHYGSVGIYKDYGTATEKLLTKVSPNEFFGEMGLVENVNRSATAVVLTDETTLEVISLSDLKELFEQNPPKVEMILEHLSYRLRKLTKDYMTACKLTFRISEADYRGNELSGEIATEAKDFVNNLYV